MSLPDPAQILIILFVVFLIFGAVKVPALGEAIGVRLSRMARRSEKREIQGVANRR